MTQARTEPLLVIIDDEPEIIAALKRCLLNVEVTIESFTSGREALAFMEQNQPSMVISDQRMPITSGLEVLTQVKKLWPHCSRVMLSAYQDFDTISKAFNDKIIDKFIEKPWVNKELVWLVSDTISKPALNKNTPQGMIGESANMLALFEKLRLSSNANLPIFIHGETGTGKELIAKACHQQGCKQAGKFVAVNCANFSEHLIESQLFGHQKGAFTGAVGNQKGLLAESCGGTLFLDEITTLPLGLQAKLLRVIQERKFSPLGSNQELEFDAQLISASALKLSEAVLQGLFREDLYYRLHVIPLSIPPLRERNNDITLLANHFINKFCSEHNSPVKALSSQAESFINSYSWPGNVRQLENLIYSACVLSEQQEISLNVIQSLIEELGSNSENSHRPPPVSNQVAPTDESLAIIPLEQVERLAIEQAIASSNGNITLAASQLKVNPSTLYRKMQKWQKEN